MEVDHESLIANGSSQKEMEAFFDDIDYDIFVPKIHRRIEIPWKLMPHPTHEVPIKQSGDFDILAIKRHSNRRGQIAGLVGPPFTSTAEFWGQG